MKYIPFYLYRNVDSNSWNLHLHDTIDCLNNLHLHRPDFCIVCHSKKCFVDIDMYCFCLANIPNSDYLHIVHTLGQKHWRIEVVDEHYRHMMTLILMAWYYLYQHCLRIVDILMSMSRSQMYGIAHFDYILLGKR